jgi:2-C-methyl-D-erythritol 4-phosphate cytidylyltransferase
MAAHGRSTVAAILVAAGSGERLGAGLPKAFVRLGDATLLEHALARFAGHPAVRQVIVVAPPTRLDEAAELTGHPVVPGGATRQASVAAGLAALEPDVEYVLVHDVARPFVPAEVIDAVVAALRAGADAVVPTVPIHDTVRRVQPDGSLDGIVDRTQLAAVQTPQGFRRAVLLAAHERADGAPVTDDAGLVEALGGRVVSVPGADEAFKITTAADLARAEAMCLGSGGRPPR